MTPESPLEESVGKSQGSDTSISGDNGIQGNPLSYAAQPYHRRRWVKPLAIGASALLFVGGCLTYSADAVRAIGGNTAVKSVSSIVPLTRVNSALDGFVVTVIRDGEKSSELYVGKNGQWEYGSNR